MLAMRIDMVGICEQMAEIVAGRETPYSLADAIIACFMEGGAAGR